MRTAVIILLLHIPILAIGQKKVKFLQDSLLSEITEHKKDTSLVSLYYLLSYSYSDNHPDSGLLFARQAIGLANELKWEKGKAAAYSAMGGNYNALSDRYNALAYYSKALAIYRSRGLTDNEAGTLSNIALVYHKQSNYALALEYYLQALATMEQTGNKKSMAITYENIGTLYKEQNDYVKTVKYYEKAIELNNELNDFAGMARNLGNMGIVYDAEGRHAQALRSHLSAYETNKDIGNKNGMQINLANIGIVYMHMGKLQEAVEKHREALTISEELGDKTSMAINTGNLGETYTLLAQKTGQDIYRKNAILHLERAVNLCKESNAWGPAAEFVKLLSEAYVLSGDYRQAYRYQKMLTTINDTLHSVQSKLQIANLENKREVTLKEKDLQLKNKQIQIAQLEIKKRRAQQGFYAIGILLLVILLIITIKGIVSSRKHNRRLTDEKRLHLKTILDQNIEIKARNKILEELAHKHSHDIRGHVATIMGLSALLNRQDYTDVNNEVIIDGMATSAGALDKVIKEIVLMENELTSISEEKKS